LKPRLELHEVRLRGLDLFRWFSGCGRAGAWDAAPGRAAESTKVDFAILQRRIHSLLQADGTLPVQIPDGPQSFVQADGT
jgi:hypothetical protein